VSRLPRSARLVIAILIGIVAINVALRLLDSSTRGADETAPDSSSLSTGSTGVAAWSELLERDGHAVDAQRGDVGDDFLDPDSTVVVLEPSDLEDDDVQALRVFVDAGGRLVTGGASSTPLLTELLGVDEAPEWSTGRASPAEPDSSAPEVDGLREVEAVGPGLWRGLGDTDPLLADDERRVLAAATDVGDGRVVMLADVSPVQNRLLDRADNAAFALAIAGDRDRAVVFAEGVHGFGDGTGLGAIPGRWKAALLGLVAASLLGAVAAGRRLGPPEEDARPLPPPRRAYVEGMAETLARTKQPAAALAPLQRAARAELARRAGVPPDADEATLHAVATRMGWTAAEVAAVFRPPADDEDVLATGRVLARLKSGETIERELGRTP